MTRPCGLTNNGNTCYFNAVIQVLFQTTVFVQHVKNVFPSTSENDKAGNADMKRRLWNWIWQRLCCILSLLKILWNKFKKFLTSCALKVSCIDERRLHSQQDMGSLQTCPAPNKCPAKSKIWNVCPVLALAAFILIIFITTWLPAYFRKSFAAKVFYWIQHCRLYKTFQFLLIRPLMQLCVTAFRFVKWLLSNILEGLLSTPFGPKVRAATTAVTNAATTAVLIFQHRICILMHLIDLVLPVSKPEPVGAALKNLFDELSSTTDKGSVNPGSVLKAVSSRAARFAGHRQQDSHELLRHMLDGLRADERQLNQLKQNMVKLTLVDKIFGGHFITVYTCLQCEEVYSLCEPFLDISLPLVIHKDTLKEVSVGISPPPVAQEDTLEGDSDDASPPAMEQDTLREVSDGVSPPTVTREDSLEGFSDLEVSAPNQEQKMYLMEHSIETLLKVYTRKEDLGKEYLCNTCNKDRTDGGYDLTGGTKEALICDPPAVLCLHMKRFKEVPGAGYFEKVNAHITFKEILDLKPYLSKDCKRVDIKQTSVLYSLYGVVVHSGSLRGGHYVAYVKSAKQQTQTDNLNKFLQHEDVESRKLTIERDFSDLMSTAVCGENQQELNSTNDWYCCSDMAVCRVDAREVFRQQAFLLFYERIF